MATVFRGLLKASLQPAAPQLALWAAAWPDQEWAAVEAVSMPAKAAVVRRESGRGAEAAARAAREWGRCARADEWARFPRWITVDATAPPLSEVLPVSLRWHRYVAQPVFPQPETARLWRRRQVARVREPGRGFARARAGARQPQSLRWELPVAQEELRHLEHAALLTRQHLRRRNWSEFFSR
jgi:hypothetical protein